MFVEINPKMWYNIFIVHLEIGGIYNMVDSYKVLLLENELNAAPLGDVDNQRIISKTTYGLLDKVFESIDRGGFESCTYV